MKIPLVSVIVPVYKAEKWLHRCVDSILAQTMTDFELLLIEDGSPDRSGEICDEYAAKDSRVRVFHKENGGVSSARNLGLENAQGEWISFIDADDWVDVDYLAGLTDNLDADFITGGLKDTIGGICIVENKLYSYLNVKEFLNQYNRSCILRAACGKLVRRRIINDNKLRFDTKIRWGEDTVFNKRYLLYCTTIRTIKFANYNYYIADTITTNEKYSLKLDDIDYVSNIIKSTNILLKDKFRWNVDEDEIKVSFLQLGLFDEIVDNFDRYVELCQKYYCGSNINFILADSFMSPIVKGLMNIKLLYERRNFDRVRLVYNKLCFFSRKMPWIIKFSYKNFYIWYFLIKCGWWCVFDFLMKKFYAQ